MIKQIFDTHEYTVKGYDSWIRDTIPNLDETYRQTMGRKYAFPYNLYGINQA